MPHIYHFGHCLTVEAHKFLTEEATIDHSASVGTSDITELADSPGQFSFHSTMVQRTKMYRYMNRRNERTKLIRLMVAK